MYKPSDFLPYRQKWRGARLAAVSLVALVAVTGLAVLQLPRGATAGVTSTSGDDRIVPRVAPPSPGARGKAPTAYQLRCWQNGWLLFEEVPVILGPEALEGTKMVVMDRHGAAVIVTANVNGTTCLARPAPPPPSLALPR